MSTPPERPRVAGAGAGRAEHRRKRPRWVWLLLALLAVVLVVAILLLTTRCGGSSGPAGTAGSAAPGAPQGPAAPGAPQGPAAPGAPPVPGGPPPGGTPGAPLPPGPPPTAAPSGAPASTGSGSSTAAAVAGRIERIVAATPVTFRPDSPRLTASGSRGLDAVVRELARAPGTRVTVTGYAAVIAQGMGADPLRLSQQRAAAVTTRMSAAGVGADRVDMRGASNSDPRPTVAGSRRVEFAVS